jgi:hypothetical protein
MHGNSFFERIGVWKRWNSAMNKFVSHELGVFSAREDSWLCINVAAACSGNGNRIS